MDFKWLEDFLSLAATHSFSCAAEVREVTQSAFNRRIRTLEEWLGANLVNRETLTEEGKLFRETVEEAVRMLSARQAEFRHRTHSGVPQIELTALHSLTVTFLPIWLSHIQSMIGPVASRVITQPLTFGWDRPLTRPQLRM